MKVRIRNIDIQVVPDVQFKHELLCENNAFLSYSEEPLWEVSHISLKPSATQTSLHV